VKEDADQEVTATVQDLLRAEIATRYLGIVEIIERDQLDRLGAFPGAIVALEAVDGYYFSMANPAARVLQQGDPCKGMHGYLPTNPEMATGFIASGRGIRPGVIVPTLRMLDVAPTIAALLNLDLPTAEGVPVIGILTPTKE
jgi:hypothetical protein